MAKKLERPLVIGGNEAYPLTTADQIIKACGSRLETADGISVDNAVNAEKLDGKEASYFASTEDVHNSISEINTEITNKIPFGFGIDSNGNYGYIKAGADTVTPFTSFNFEIIGNKSSYDAGTLTINDCEIGRKYMCIINSWSGSGSSSAIVYCRLSSYTGCTVKTLLERPDGNQGAYIIYELTATNNTMVLNFNDAIAIILK